MLSVETLIGAMASLGRHKLRSFLTMLGMIFGVGAVIAMLSIGAGAEEESLRAIANLGIRNIIIQAKDFKTEELRQIRAESLGVSMRDVEALQNVLKPKPLITASRVIKTYQINSGTMRSDSRVLGVSSAYPEIQNLKLLQGAFFSAREESDNAQVCVLGMAAKQKLFGFEDAIGKQIKVNDVWLTVVGVLGDAVVEKQEFEGVKVQNPNNDIFIPITTSLRKFDVEAVENELNEIIIKIDESANIKEQAATINNLISVMHRYVDDYSIVVPEKLLEQNQKTQEIFNIVMGAIASISLLVGGIGIMNIMLASVLERTSEIGLRRAIGARKVDIRVQFIAEAVAISFAGGLIGIGLGYSISQAVALFSGWSTIVTAASVGLSFGVSSIIGLIFGIYPAVQASNLDPIECLRYE
ncbi:MAG: ABC transporter permease [Acidobacteriota bacterium]|jgi:putative ABC transport system permease protein|nr:ABC transporter permease [Acidobacteriota bacterium]